ncbi:MAG: competence/damage-inducible protein A [Oscillospiraceae bacterium]
MTAEIISVGTELLLGDILNTNARFLSRELAALGIDVFFQSVVGDNPERLAEVARLSKSRSDILVFTGGLGPTNDDLTKETVANVFGDTLIHSDNELARIESYFSALSSRKMPVNNYKQAMLPTNGQAIPNANGTAPGAIFTDNGKYAVLLPGPPSECVPMFLNAVRPWLLSLSHSALYSINLRTCGVGESHLEEMVADFTSRQNPSVALYAKTGEVVIRVTAKAENEAIAREECTVCCGKLREKLGNLIYGTGDDGIEHALVRLLKEHGEKISTAESCTGGLLSARITNVPGASEVFEYGVCTYANIIKENVLNVRHDTLTAYGAVSAEVACEMACGAQREGAADYGIGITGLAGPGGGTAEKPVGLVYIALANKNNVYVHRMQLLNRSRDIVRENAVQRALNMARLLVSGLDIPDCICKKR